MSDALIVTAYVGATLATAYLWVIYMHGATLRYVEGDDFLFAAMLGLLWPVSLFILAFAFLLAWASGEWGRLI